MPDRPQDVPDELLLVALSAWTGKTLRSLYDLIEVDGDEHGAMERTLRALLPEIERRVRGQVATESAVLRPADLAEILNYVAGHGDVRVVHDETLDRAFAALKATLPASGEGR